jgi:hypothetical protein
MWCRFEKKCINLFVDGLRAPINVTWGSHVTYLQQPQSHRVGLQKALHGLYVRPLVVERPECRAACFTVAVSIRESTILENRA